MPQGYRGGYLSHDRETERNGATGEDRVTVVDRVRLKFHFLRLTLIERIKFDSAVVRWLISLGGYLLSLVFRAFGRKDRAFTLTARLHRANYGDLVNHEAESLAREAARCAAAGTAHSILTFYERYLRNLQPASQIPRVFSQPEMLLRSLAVVLKSPSGAEKGVLMLKYSHTFPLFAARYDVQSIAQRYHIVLEPDWSGYCDPNILLYSRYPFPVFVQAYESRDAKLIADLGSNLVVVPTSTNWWVDHRLFYPMPAVVKDRDIVMVAGFAPYKRHYQFFQALARLRAWGHRPSVLLLGFPSDYSYRDILQQAELVGVADQIEIHESVPFHEVNGLINRAKVILLWSRKEGVNRAIIEGMYANIPCIVRAGFNYGCPYPYINEHTGCFSTERDLPRTLLTMIEQYSRFRPREWVINYMSPQRATQILSEVIEKVARSRGEDWTNDIAVKVDHLSKVAFWDPAHQKRFEPDYAFLESAIRP
jgi:glycosyltransferase involved in cell wall biosynthesis